MEMGPQEAWQLLRALGIPESLRVIRATIHIEVGKQVTADITTHVGVDKDNKEIVVLTEKYELVRRSDGGQAPT